MACILGIDTSNYTTSCSIYNTETNTVIHRKKLLPVKFGECGIRQSDAVFHHTQQLPTLIESLFSEFSGKLDAVCVSSVPRRQQDSYMPCFTVGHSVARSLSASMKIPLFDVSHQQGHIAAALFSSGTEYLIRERFLAFHVSGGTTEAILVTPDEGDVFRCEIVGKTLDLNAGQLIDRVGVMLSMQFPCGKELEAIASEYSGTVKVKPVLKNTDCCLSGFENKLRDLFEKTQDKPQVAAQTLAYIEATISAMTQEILGQYGDMPIVYAGGVMSNKIIRKSLEAKINCHFAEPEFSCDNAVGVAYLGGYKLLNQN